MRISSSAPYSRPRLYFGWGPEQHTLIEKQSALAVQVNEDGSSTLGRFLMDWLPDIHRRSQLIDLPPKPGEPPRPSDSINLDTGGKRPTGMEDVVLPYKETPLSEIAPHFQLDDTQRFQDLSWETVSKYETTAAGYSGNVLTSSDQSYKRLVDLLKQVDQCPVDQRGALCHALLDGIGDLFQYLGDVCQPQHETTYCNWKLPYSFFETNADGSPKRWSDGVIKEFNGMHAFVEGQMVTEGLKLTSPTIQSLSPQEVRAQILAMAKQAYQQMFGLVQAGMTAERQTDSITEYFQCLKVGVQPIVQKQMMAAIQLCANVITSAYVEAGSPNLALLHTIHT